MIRTEIAKSQINKIEVSVCNVKTTVFTKCVCKYQEKLKFLKRNCMSGWTNFDGSYWQMPDVIRSNRLLLFQKKKTVVV